MDIKIKYKIAKEKLQKGKRRSGTSGQIKRREVPKQPPRRDERKDSA